MLPVMPRWLLYYSASSVFCRKDSKNPPPMYIGIAAAPAVEGPYRRINEKPFLGTSDGVPQVIGSLALLDDCLTMVSVTSVVYPC